MLLVSLALIAAGLAWLARAPVSGSYFIDLFPAMIVLGVGGGLAFPALMTLAMSGATPEDSGLASGLVNTTQQVGGSIGLAVLATVAANTTGGATDAASLVDGYSAAFTVASALVFVALVLGAVVLRRGPSREMVRGGPRRRRLAAAVTASRASRGRQGDRFVLRGRSCGSGPRTALLRAVGPSSQTPGPG